MDDSIPRIQPRTAIAPTGSRRDPRRRGRDRESVEPAVEGEPEPSTASRDASDDPSVDVSVGRAAYGEPGTNLDLTA